MTKMLLVGEVALLLNVSESLVYDWAQTGLLPCYRFGKSGKRGSIRFEEADVLAFKESQKQKTEQAAKPAPFRKIVLKHLKLKSS
jgi:excisionase family DNA binding protein